MLHLAHDGALKVLVQNEGKKLLGLLHIKT
jgi:hypothetical protein